MNSEGPYSPPVHEGQQGQKISRDRVSGAGKGCAVGGCAIPFFTFTLLFFLSLIFESGSTPLIIVFPCFLALIGAPLGIILGAVIGISRKSSKNSN